MPLPPRSEKFHTLQNGACIQAYLICRVLDAPGIADDYYLSLLDWSASNILAVGLGNAVYLWNATSGSVQELCQVSDEGDSISSVSWCADGTHLAIGDSIGRLHLWDVEDGTRVRLLKPPSFHTAERSVLLGSRIGSMSWNDFLISGGSRDGLIRNHDIRAQKSLSSEWKGHDGDVCGLKWSGNGQQLGSGGNDNLVNIWDARSSIAKFTKTEHVAAVKVFHLRTSRSVGNRLVSLAIEFAGYRWRQ